MACSLRSKRCILVQPVLSGLPPTPRPGRAVSLANAARLARPGRGFVGRYESQHWRQLGRVCPPTPRPGRAVSLPGLPADLLPPVSPRSRDARFRDSDARFRVSIEVAHSSVAALEEIVRPVAKPVLVVLNLDVVTNFAPDFSRY